MNWKRNLILLLITTSLVYIQTTFLNILAFNQIKPDLVLIAVVFISLAYGNRTAMVLGFLAGLTQDFISLSPLGFHSFINVIVAYTVGLLGNNVSLTSWVFQLIITAVITVIKYLLAFFLISLFSISQNNSILMSSMFLIELVYNSLVAPLFFIVGNWLMQRSLRN